MSRQFFIYDYYMAKDVINNICLHSKRMGKATLKYISLDFSQGRISFDLKGSDALYGVVFKLTDQDIVTIQRYIEARFNVRLGIVALTVVTQTTKKLNVETFIPTKVARDTCELPNPLYFDMLESAYCENNFSTTYIRQALWETITKVYPILLINKEEEERCQTNT